MNIVNNVPCKVLSTYTNWKNYFTVLLRMAKKQRIKYTPGSEGKANFTTHNLTCAYIIV